MEKERITKLQNLPEQLRTNGEFCLWKYETKDGRPTKVPYNPNNTTKHASVNKPETFSTFEKATATATSKFNGIGVRISRTITGVDIDHCFDDDGNLSETAQDIITMLNCYTEKSPSGKGLHLYFTAPAVDFTKEKYYIKHGDIEVYIDGYTNRYLTVTGDCIRSSDIVDRSRELQDVLDRYMLLPAQPESAKTATVTAPLELSDAEILEKAFASKTGAKLKALYDGQWQGYFNSQSEADQALCNMLAFWYGRNPERIDAVFCASGLYREKWNRSDYRSQTIANAIATTTETYTPKNQQKSSAGATSMPTVPDQTDKDVPPEKVAPDATPTPAPAPEPTPQECVDAFFGEIQSRRFEPIPTGIDQLDRALQGGLERRTLVTIASAPGAGKTAIAQYILENMASKGYPIAYVNLEMDRSQLLSRSIARISYDHRRETGQEPVTALKVKRGYSWNPYERDVIEYCVSWYKRQIAPSFHYITTNPADVGHIDNTMSDILSKLERVTAEYNAKGKPSPIICIDYLQFIDYDLWKTEDGQRKPDNAESIKQILNALKRFAMEHDTVVIVITANNRASNSEGKASMDSGRDTSNIEYSGDVMLSLVYTAVEEGWHHNSGNVDKYGNYKPALIDNDFINYVVDYSRKINGHYPTIAKLLSLKVVKGRSIMARGVAKFYYEGAYFNFETDKGHTNKYWNEPKNEPFPRDIDAMIEDDQ